MLAGAGGRYPRRWAGASPARAPRMPARPPGSQPLAAALARRRVCVRARSHCSISASRCAPPSPGPRSLAGSGPLPAPGALEMAPFGPPPTRFPSPPSWLCLICCHLRTREQARAPASSMMHGQLRGRSGRPAPAPEPAGPERGVVGRRRKRHSLLGPSEPRKQTPCFPRNLLSEEGTQIRNPCLLCRAGGTERVGTSVTHPTCSSLSFLLLVKVI